MADQKITQLTALTSAANTDVIPIVDVAGNETKKIEVQNLIPPSTAPNTITDGSGLANAGDYGGGTDLLVWIPGTVTAGVCYGVSPTGWVVSDATSVSNLSTGLLVIAPASGSAFDGMIVRGIVRVSVDPGGSIGDVVYLSTTPGQFTTTPVASPNNVSRVVGYKVTANTIFFDPSKDWIEIS